MIVFQKFPARVVMSDGRTYDPTAVVVTYGHVRVAERRGATVNVIADIDLHGADVDVEQLPNRNTRVTFPDGSTWEVSRGKGCSCGSPLKRWFLSTVAAG